MGLDFYQVFFPSMISKKGMQLACLFDHIMGVVVLISVLVLYWTVVVLKSPAGSRGYKEHKPLETAWTVLPALLLLWVALPSLFLLYKHDETPSSVFTAVKAVGHQWYWEYEYSAWEVFKGSSKGFDSYMVRDPDLKSGEYRLLVTDKPLVLPYGVPVRMLITSADVIHSMALPAMGVKADAIPGRINQVVMASLKPGIVSGMCSEICGDAHAYMPIEVEFISPSDYRRWLKSFRG